MRKTNGKDFLVVLQNLETILQEQTKISKRQSAHKTTNSKKNSTSMKSSKNKTKNIEFHEKVIEKNINKLNTKTPSPKRPRKLYKNAQENTLFSTSTQYSSSKTPEIRKKSHDYQSPQTYKNEVKLYTHSPSSSPKAKRRIRHNSPIEQIGNDNDNSIKCTNQNYTASQLNTLCIFFLRWMKKCTEKIEAESQKKANSTNEPFEKPGPNNNMPNDLNSSINTLSNSNTLSIERVECDPKLNDKMQMDLIPSNKIEIVAAPKSFQTNLPKSIIRNSNENKKSSANLSPQQEKQNIEYLHPNCKNNQSQDNSLTTKSTNQAPNPRRNNTNKRVNFSDSINNKKIKNTSNNKKKTTKKINDKANNTNETNKDIEDVNASEKNINTEKETTNISTASNLNDDEKNANDKIASNTSNNNFDSDEEICKLNLEETSPIPTPNIERKMPSIGESDLNNQPNSEDIHYDSYELSEKSLSLLPPQGEGEVTDFNPSNF